MKRIQVLVKGWLKVAAVWEYSNFDLIFMSMEEGEVFRLIK